MPRRFLTNIDLTGFSLLGAMMHPVTSDPTGLGVGDAGRVWFRTDTGRLMVWSGTAAVDLLDLGSATGTLTASKVSDFNTAVRLNRLDQMAPPTASVTLNGQRITSVGDATAATDAVNRQYLESQLSGLTSGQVLKGSVRVASTSNVNIASPGASIDGVSLSNGDYVLLAGQSTASQNGPWVWTAAGSALTRPPNWDSDAEATLGSFWIIREGTQSDTYGLLTNDTAITLGTTALTIVFRGAASISYTAGAGLVLSGNDFAVGAGTGISVAADAVSIDTARVPRKWSGLIPTTSGTVDGLPITVSGATVTFNHATGNNCPNLTVRYGTSPPSGGTARARVEIDDGTAAGDANNLVCTLPEAPAANAYFFMLVA
jgi:hypothetical protein